MPNTLTVDLASLNKDQFQRLWNVIFGEPEIDYKHAHEVDKANFDSILAKRDAEIRKLDAEIDLLRRDAEDAYKRGYSEGKDAGREDVYKQLPISDVDGLHKAALEVCDADDADDSSVMKVRLGRAIEALANAACWSPKLSPEDAEAARQRLGPFGSDGKPLDRPEGHPDAEPRFTAHVTDVSGAIRYYIADNETENDFVVGFPSYESAAEVVRLIESGDLDPDLVTSGSEFVAFTTTNSLVREPKASLPVSIRFASVKPNRYAVSEEGEDEDGGYLILEMGRGVDVLVGFELLCRAEEVCAQMNSGEFVLPEGGPFEYVTLTVDGMRVRDRSAYIDIFKK